jgi:hypothetical protein
MLFVIVMVAEYEGYVPVLVLSIASPIPGN